MNTAFFRKVGIFASLLLAPLFLIPSTLKATEIENTSRSKSLPLVGWSSSDDSGYPRSDTLGNDEIVDEPFRQWNGQVDEELFCICLLQYICSEWPTSWADRDDVVERIAWVQVQLEKNLEYIQDHGVDQRVGTMFVNAIGLTEEYANTLAELDIIDRTYYQSRKEIIFHTVVAVVRDSAHASRIIFRLIPEKRAAVAVSIITYITVATKTALEGYIQLQKLELEREHRIRERILTFMAKQQRVFGRLEVLPRWLEESKGWETGAGGFDQADIDEVCLDSPVDRVALPAVYSREDRRLALDALLESGKRRPQDPFLLLAIAQLRAAESTEQKDVGRKCEMAETAAADLLAAAERVPRDEFFDSFRVTFLSRAALLEASVCYWREEQSGEPLALARKAREYDANESLHVARAMAQGYARNGQPERGVEELLKFSRRLGARGRFELACLHALAGDFNPAVRRVNHVLATGRVPISAIRTNRDLSELWSARPEELEKIRNFSCPYWPVYGVLWNEVTLANKASFPLKNVVLKVEWTSTEGDVIQDVMYEEGPLAAGSERVWSGFLRGATHKKKRDHHGELYCDQTRPTPLLTSFDIAGRYSGVCTWQAKKKTTKATFVVSTQKMVLQFGDEKPRSTGFDDKETFDVTACNEGVFEGRTANKTLRLWARANCVYGIIRVDDETDPAVVFCLDKDVDNNS